MRLFSLLLLTAIYALSLAGCGAMYTSAEQEVPKGSLTKSYQLIDEMGRVSGTLVLEPMGRAVLRDADNKVIGVFSSDKGFSPESNN